MHTPLFFFWTLLLFQQTHGAFVEIKPSTVFVQVDPNLNLSVHVALVCRKEKPLWEQGNGAEWEVFKDEHPYVAHGKRKTELSTKVTLHFPHLTKELHTGWLSTGECRTELTAIFTSRIYKMGAEENALPLELALLFSRPYYKEHLQLNSQSLQDVFGRQLFYFDYWYISESHVRFMLKQKENSFSLEEGHATPDPQSKRPYLLL